METRLPFRLLALDLDGTIVDSHMQVSPRVRRALSLAMAAGVHVTLASGRFFVATRLFANDLGIHEPLICYQGALIQDPVSEEVSFRCGVPLHLACEFIEFVRGYHWDLCLHLDDGIYAERVTPLVRFYVEYSPVQEKLHTVTSLQALLSQEPLKLVIVTEPEQAAAVDATLQRRFAGRLRVVRSFSRFIEATNLEVSKGRALQFLAQQLGMAQAETMAIGDNDNDADMVAWAGLGVAMGNATPAVKSVADYIAPPIEEDGAAQAIERFVLEQAHV